MLVLAGILLPNNLLQKGKVKDWARAGRVSHGAVLDFEASPDKSTFKVFRSLLISRQAFTMCILNGSIFPDLCQLRGARSLFLVSFPGTGECLPKQGDEGTSTEPFMTSSGEI